MSSLSRSLWCRYACTALLSTSFVHGIALDPTDPVSIKAAAKIVAADLTSYYTPNLAGQIVGQLPYPPYYWWESGAMWGTLIHYWHYTGDDTYNDIITTGIEAQVGEDDDFEPTAQTAQLGNDDQAFWGMTAMSAAEFNFPNPPSTERSWLGLAQAVFNRQVPRWDTATCNGGLRWQIFPFNGGYDYKNSISNGCLFNIAARLAKYTGNTTYSDWAEKIYDWELDIGLIDPSAGYAIYDGTTPSINCSQIDHLEWSYVLGVHLYGAAVMWNITQSDTWRQRTQSLLDSSKTYFKENTAKTSPWIMWEAECEDSGTNGVGNCDTDQLSFKAYLARWMAQTTKLAPWTYDTIIARLEPSAVAAAETCTGGTNGTQCGFKWYTGAYDGNTGPGQEMCALEVIQGLLVNNTVAPVTASTGGTSESDPDAGTGDGIVVDTGILDITNKDRGGAWTLTALLAFVTVGGGAWVLI